MILALPAAALTHLGKLLNFFWVSVSSSVESVTMIITTTIIPLILSDK